MSDLTLSIFDHINRIIREFHAHILSNISTISEVYHFAQFLWFGWYCTTWQRRPRLRLIREMKETERGGRGIRNPSSTSDLLKSRFPRKFHFSACRKLTFCPHFGILSQVVIEFQFVSWEMILQLQARSLSRKDIFNSS